MEISPASLTRGRELFHQHLRLLLEDIVPVLLLNVPVQVEHCPLFFSSGFRKFLLHHSENHGVSFSKQEMVTVDQLQIADHDCSVARLNRRIDRLQLVKRSRSDVLANTPR